MSSNALPTLQTSGSVGSKFVSQEELDDAKRQKEEEWKAAYARIGEEPPPMPQDETYDPRSLFEKLDSQKQAKREEWDDKMRMSNQWRGLEADEVAFLKDIAAEEKMKEKSVKQKELEELAAFRLRQAQSQNVAPGPSTSPPVTETTPPTQIRSAAQQKKGVKSLLKGVVRKRNDANTKASGNDSSAPDSKANPAHSPDAATTTTTTQSSAPPVAPLPIKVRIGHAAAREAPPAEPPKRKLGLAAAYGDSSDEEASHDDAPTDTKKQKT